MKIINAFNGHICHLNPVKNHPERITTGDKEIAKNLNYSGITFPVQIRDIKKIEKANQLILMFSVMIMVDSIQSESQMSIIMIIWNSIIH